VLGSPLKTRWSYSTSKAVDEILAYVYWKEKNVPTVIVRLFNTVGPRQSGAYGMVIPRFVSQALGGSPLQVHGNGKQTRCFLHVRDVVGALIKLMEAPSAVGQVFNLGSQEEVTIEEVAKRVVRIVGSGSVVEYIPYDKAYEEGYEDMPRRVPDISRIRALIDFEPTMNLDQIIQSVVDSMRGTPAPAQPAAKKPRAVRAAGHLAVTGTPEAAAIGAAAECRPRRRSAVAHPAALGTRARSRAVRTRRAVKVA